MSEIQIIDIINQSKSDLKALTALILGLGFLSKELGYKMRNCFIYQIL